VHHTASTAIQEMFEAIVAGAGNEDIEGVEVVIRPALTAADVLAADGYLLGTPVAIALAIAYAWVTTEFSLSMSLLAALTWLMACCAEAMAAMPPMARGARRRSARRGRY
jgi:hypothetical protein